MNPRERIATILFIEQIKHTEAHFCQSVKYKEIVKKKGEKTCSEKPEVIAEQEPLRKNTDYRLAPFATATEETLAPTRKSERLEKNIVRNKRRDINEKNKCN